MSRTPLLILRPEPGASMTAKRAFDEGWRPIVAPIFRIEPIAWAAPAAADYDALFVTSANAVRQAGKAIRAYQAMPAYAVGDATARALKATGFGDIRTGRGDAAVMLEAEHMCMTMRGVRAARGRLRRAAPFGPRRPAFCRPVRCREDLSP